MSTLPVTTSLGSFRGVALAGVSAFLGVPYAAPPRGALCFEAPQPPAPWLGVRDAIAHGPAPHQLRRATLELDDACRSLLAPNEAKRRRWAEALYTETPR